MSKEIKYIKLVFSIVAIGLTLLIGSSLVWNIYREKQVALQYARIEALSSYNKDLLYRKWASMHGGVYVPITNTTKPNPYLKFIKERDIKTPSGQDLTLVNPAYMTRQVFTMASLQKGTQGHITSLNPIRPENKADAWESLALKKFESGDSEYSGIELINDVPHLRFMKFLKVENGCLKCHGNQGYKLGDIRGGISVSVPLEQYYIVAAMHTSTLITNHLLVYFALMILGTLGFLRILREMKKRIKMQSTLIEHEVILKKQNADYELVNQELKILNSQYQHAKDIAEKSDNLKTAFLQNMSHEIRTPMNAIIGFSELMIKHLDDKQKLSKFADVINQRCNDLLDLINDILDIARIESGHVLVNMVSCNIKSIFSELKITFSEIQRKLGKEHINFVFELPIELSQVNIHTDKLKLKQILTNLITNALKFTENGRITIGCKKYSTSTIIFYVSDTGAGIPADKQQFIFDRFAQLESNNSAVHGGTGLGLSIVKGLVDALNGRIWIESAPDKGSTFQFSLPFVERNDEIPEKIEFHNEDKINLSGRIILVVEDDPDSANYIKELLNDFELKILFTTLGKEAIEIVTTQKIDLVLLDIRLPDMNGFDVARLMRQNKPDINIIAQTAYAAHEDQNKAIAAGCDGYLGKPIKRSVFLETINTQFTKPK
jgi:signal transduction histidine kinase/CheY-like chemotaxis protein